jgi:hypothetical protein
VQTGVALGQELEDKMPVNEYYEVTWRTKIHETNWMILEANFWIIFQNFDMLLASSFKSGLLTLSYLR